MCFPVRRTNVHKSGTDIFNAQTDTFHTKTGKNETSQRNRAEWADNCLPAVPVSFQLPGVCPSVCLPEIERPCDSAPRVDVIQRRVRLTRLQNVLRVRGVAVLTCARDWLSDSTETPDAPACLEFGCPVSWTRGWRSLRREPPASPSLRIQACVHDVSLSIGC